MLGQRFGSYKTVAVLGSGAMGEVFVGEHQRITRRAAIKVLKPELMQYPDAVRAFFAEASVTSSIRHPGIVEIFDCDVHRNGRAYIVMELLEGETLRALLDRDRSVPWRTACDIGQQIAEALAAAHAAGIVHRDLKPENLVLAPHPTGGPERRQVKVVDFGVARLLSGDGGDAPRPREDLPLGSPGYMSPEQCSGSPADHRADIYSLGCILFEMICGKSPYGDVHGYELLLAHRARPAPSLAQVAPRVPGWLDWLVARLLAKSAADRPQSMDEVAGALRRRQILTNDRSWDEPTLASTSDDVHLREAFRRHR